MTIRGLKENGPSAAAILAAGIACAMFAAATILSESSVAVKQWLTWYEPAGSLSGETGIAVLAWLVLWFLLNSMWKGKQLRNFKLVLGWAWALIFFGFLGTFPPIFQLFGKR